MKPARPATSLRRGSSPSSVRFEYSSTLASHDEMFDDLNATLADWGVEGRQAELIRLCVSEAYTNAVVHGNHQDPSKKVRMILALNECRVDADIVDEGEGGMAAIAARSTVGPDAESGRGVNIIQGAADSVEYVATGSGGLCVSMRFEPRTAPTR